ncbi:phenazine biosynthesis protein PhzF [Luteimicrobium album]|uniref:Phenazine biosynthesis protein PhzF n=1 Tax=Luteimicrobium album TaxID=1054550 RepID=A0ABQ6HZC1_9MICO|nr:PhzF family phenazine biosynthesis protein [Luteimicrobium album]GMA23833.1 phenazine biosynthesis protein PhzF [Luteimicrobium album]
MSASFPYREVDVFTHEPLLGNPVAVVHDAVGLDDDRLAAFARWTNLSETTFLLPPTPEGAAEGADYRLRIFTPAGELPFAGHPTLGSCHAWLEAGGTPHRAGVVVQECGVGLVAVHRDGDALAFEAPDLLADEPLEPETLDAFVTALGIPAGAVVDHRLLDNGPGWRVLLLDSAERVLSLAPDWSGVDVERFRAIGVVGPTGTTAPDEPAFEVRGFVPGISVPEDPVTGSLNAVIGQWLTSTGRAPDRYVARQGTALGRDGRVHVTRAADGTVRVGGGTVTCVTGTVTL